MTTERRMGLEFRLRPRGRPGTEAKEVECPLFPLGMPLPSSFWIEQFDQQTRGQGPQEETHLYMYGAYFVDRKRTCLHVLKVLEVGRQDSVDILRDRVPRTFYENMRRKYPNRYEVGLLIPYCFKVSDIREI